LVLREPLVALQALLACLVFKMHSHTVPLTLSPLSSQTRHYFSSFFGVKGLINHRVSVSVTRLCVSRCNTTCLLWSLHASTGNNTK